MPRGSARIKRSKPESGVEEYPSLIRSPAQKTRHHSNPFADPDEEEPVPSSSNASLGVKMDPMEGKTIQLGHLRDIGVVPEVTTDAPKLPSLRKRPMLQTLSQIPEKVESHMRISTWNTQGEKIFHVMRYMAEGDVDVTLVQESGPITENSASLYPKIRGHTIESKEHYRYSIHRYVDKSGKGHQFYRFMVKTVSKHMSVVSRYPIEKVEFFAATKKGYARHLMIVKTHGFTLLNAHSPSDRGHRASKEAQETAFGLVEEGRVDIAAGDWNRPPPESESAPAPTISHSLKGTHVSNTYFTSKTLDYFAVSKKVMVSNETKVVEMPQSDHNPAFIDVVPQQLANEPMASSSTLSLAGSKSSLGGLSLAKPPSYSGSAKAPLENQSAMDLEED